jgi:hypothetical protein
MQAASGTLSTLSPDTIAAEIAAMGA